ncbi:MAG: sugar phosphate isomerase/epimerase family protein [Acidimicrobiia bacterium]
MTLAASDLVLCAGTLPRATSFRDRVAATVAGGFAAMSLWGRDYASARRDGLTDADIRASLDANGVSIAELDPAWWWLPGATAIAADIPAGLDSEEVFAYGEAELFRIAKVVGARSINAVDIFGGRWTVDDAAEAFAALCDRARERDLLVHLEFLPWSRIPDLATAWEIVRCADRPNGGIAIDAWHYFRSGADEQLLRDVPGDRVLGIQLDDGPRLAEADLLHATLHNRLLPGDGELDLAGMLGVLREIGAVAPVGVEVFSDDLHKHDPLEIGRQAGAAAKRLLAAY